MHFLIPMIFLRMGDICRLSSVFFNYFIEIRDDSINTYYSGGET